MYFVLNGRNCFMKYDFSMIVGTLGCISGIKKLVNSISLNQNLNFQVILIIQENFDNINKLFINKEYANIDIILLESEKGLSRARNHGLKYATGNIICFPDDDVYYDNTTLLLVNIILLKSNFDFITGKTIDENRQSSHGNFPNDDEIIVKKNIFKLCNSASIFIKVKSLNSIKIEFDNALGVGSSGKRQAGEETDFILNLLESGFTGCYKPEILVKAPWKKLTLDKLIKKGYLYGRGMQFVLIKHNFSIFFRLRIIAKSILGAILRTSYSPYKATLGYSTFFGRIIEEFIFLEKRILGIFKQS